MKWRRYLEVAVQKPDSMVEEKTAEATKRKGWDRCWIVGAICIPLIQNKLLLSRAVGNTLLAFPPST